MATLDLLTGGAVSRINQMADAMMNQIPVISEQLMQTGRDIIRYIVDGLRQKLSDIRAVIASLGAQIIEEIRAMAASIVAAAKQLGLDLVNGIKDGINERIDVAIEAVRGAFNRLIGAAKDEVESDSPSKVFMRIGRDMMAGARIGIDNNAQGAADAARRAGAGAANAMNEAVEAAGPSKLEGYIGQISSAMADAIVMGKDMGKALKQVFQNIAKDLISSGIKSLLSGLFGGGGASRGSGGGGIFGALFGGFRAEGGPVVPSKAYVVGERGPEMFMPRNAGTIIPNGGMASSGIAQYDAGMPDRIAAFQEDPRLR